ncbi:hypothetical protein, partial [Paenibacillus elgii]|uniref:hypothetical protein n=1 Tax=Paenibacillus elgii TaxID=189691 RepID=UPI002040D404
IPAAGYSFRRSGYSHFDPEFIIPAARYSLQVHSGAFWAVILAPIREFIIPAAGYSLQAHSGAF